MAAIERWPNDKLFLEHHKVAVIERWPIEKLFWAPTR